MTRLELRGLVPGQLRIPPLEAVLIVVAANRPPIELSKEPKNPERIRPLGYQISDGNQLVTFIPTRLLEQILELLTAAVDVAHDESAAAHDPILGTRARETKFVQPFGR
jgi:hypothetical protein